MAVPATGQKILIAVVLALCCHSAWAQVHIKGTVYDRKARYGVPGVSVLATSGAGTLTDSLGHYNIRLAATDSLYFSYLGKATTRFAVKDLPANQPFDLSLQVSVDSLPAVTVHQPVYRLDSLENRKEYQKVFDYEPDYLSSAGSGGFGLGISLSALFSARKIRNMESLRKRLEWEEKDNYINHRYTKALVRRITGLQSPALEAFMKQNKPSYEMLKSFENEYQYYKYIKDWGEYFKENNPQLKGIQAIAP